MKYRSDKMSRGRYTVGGISESMPTRIGWWDRTLFRKDPSDFPYTLTPRYNQRPDLLANDLYGTPTLMWLVLQYNSIIDINTEFVTGAVIQLPSKSRVFSQILNT